MAELDASPPPSLAAGRSRKLKQTVIVLTILPLLLPFPFYGIADEWIGPMEQRAWQQCGSFICPSATDLGDLGCLLALGPSILVALASILFGAIGLVRARRHPTSFENTNLLQGSIVSGVAWACLLGCILWVLVYYL